jgi:predicted DNA-binding transcriptional regulator AlpA
MDKISVTIPEACKLSGLGRSSLYRLFNTGDLKPRKMGARTLILVSELEDFISNLPSANDEPS